MGCNQSLFGRPPKPPGQARDDRNSKRPGEYLRRGNGKLRDSEAKRNQNEADWQSANREKKES